ncbi:MAG TPA: efflux RND transporter periplasmic adaptor subunit [Vicinamibacterales bacterium]|nr:efflux RND transporter periplasmic adaptor subunit [Vicinamibacterales bacterium]
MKKLIAFFVLLILAGGGWWYWVKYGQAPEKPTINQATITQGDIVESVPSTGTLEAMRRFDVGSQVSGTVKAIYVDYNDIVHKDQLLAEIDPSLLQVQVEIQKANIARSESDLASQRTQLEDQKKQFERTKALAEKGLINTQAYEAAELAIKTREASIMSSEKSMISQQAALNAAELNVKYCKILAPADGVIVERRVDVGQAVQASMSTPSFFIMNTPLDKLKLTANVDESEIGKIRTGMEVRFKVDSYGQKIFKGVVENVRLNATNSNNVVTYPVWITVDNPQLELRPSMTAQLNIIISTATNVIKIPNAATRFRPNGDTYRALGLTPPGPGAGRVLAPGTQPETNNAPNANTPGPGGPGGNRNRGGQGGQNAQPATGGQNGGPNGANMQANNQRGGNRTPGQGGQFGQGGQNRQPGGGGRGMGSDLANMTPEQRQAMMERFAAGGRGTGGTGGRGGTGAGGRGGQNGQFGQNGQRGQRGAGAGNAGQTQASKLQDDASAGKSIDELWAAIIPHDSPGSVWKLEDKNCQAVKPCLNEYKIRLGVTDGTFTELKSGDLQVGDEVLTSITLPLSMRPTNPGNAGNPLLGQPQRGPGGMGGGGNPGGGGGGRGGGGGGGRGGGN